MNETISITNSILSGRKTWMIHLFLWPLCYVILLFVFTKGKVPVKIDFYYTIVFLVFLAIPVVLNFHILIPYLLRKEKYIYYLIGILAIGISFGVFIKTYFVIVIDYMFPNYFFISYLSGNDYYLVFSIFLISSTLLKLAQDWVLFNRAQNQLLKLEKQHIQTQLSALRSQVNPHFLFNALNVIYAMSLDQNKNMTQAIVELSDILRYVIYDTNTERVVLKDEIQLLQNYIAFQKHRVKDTPVTFELSVENEEFKIYPMLLLPLLENAYKYGSSTDKEINIILLENEQYFKFSIVNSKVNKKIDLDDNYSGLGLSVLKNNLEIVYKHQYVLDIVDEENTFKVELTLNKN